MVSDYRGKNKFHIGAKYAWNGLKVAVQTERNIKIHFVAGIMASLLGMAVSISVIEWVLLILTISAVISMELMNTALERALNHLEPDHQPAIGIAKDLAAAAVFITAIAAFLIGCLIFIPYFFEIF
ncbi:diacylglycerol kinase family protein [Gracilibacillus caseinilyticus]|uniref:Diacylglycerol kinase family protein n=1 Tax=Gracilibacillus caseinilyticus TaxID=2932256 RepID=A0ABY4ETL6_9BACI|nr:diacylglycerol kinase family protein [Gracilibacillus caseinilyticus]UOQ47416.1 diacylglycerol kinase family protein [Gracilibacillus caseinilyticus]